MAIDVGIGISTQRDPVFAAEEAVKIALSYKQKTEIDSAILFSTLDLSSVALLKTVMNSLGERLPIIGASSSAIISPQGIFKHGVVVMLLSFPEDVSFDTAYVKDIKTKTPLNAGKELADKLFFQFQGKPRNLGLIFSDHLLKEDDNLTISLQEKLNKDLSLLEISTSDNSHALKSYLYFNQELLHDSAVGIIWGGNLKFGLGIKHGWKPLGKPRTVTRAEGNIVYEIDNVSAVKVYEEYFARSTIELQKEIKYISALYPLGIHLKEEEEYLLRNIVSIEENGSLILQGNVAVGSQIRLMIGTKESVLSATQQAISKAKNNFAGKPDFVLVFDSVSRYILLRNDAPLELAIIQEALGKDTPIIGLYAYGEQASLKTTGYQGEVYFHNQTIALLAIGV